MFNSRRSPTQRTLYEEAGAKEHWAIEQQHAENLRIYAFGMSDRGSRRIDQL